MLVGRQRHWLAPDIRRLLITLGQFHQECLIAIIYLSWLINIFLHCFKKRWLNTNWSNARKTKYFKTIIPTIVVKKCTARKEFETCFGFETTEMPRREWISSCVFTKFKFFLRLEFRISDFFSERLLALMETLLQMQNIKSPILLTSDKWKPKQLTKNKGFKHPGSSALTCVDRP